MGYISNRNLLKSCTGQLLTSCGNDDDGKECGLAIILVEHKTSPQGHINTLQIKYTNNLTFCLIKSLPCMEKVSLLPLLSRNTVWVLTQILKYLRAASLSCFAVKWLPLHQWNNNWYDNRFIWASSSLQCYFVEWRVKAMAVRSHFWFVCVCLKACCLLSVGGQS